MPSSQAGRRNAIAFCGILALTAGLSPARAGDVEAGAALAAEHCARCHVIGDGRTLNGIGSTPSFPGLVNNLDDWQERFSTFFARPPHPAFVRLDGVEPPTPLPPSASPVVLTPMEAEAIFRYVESLKRD